MASALSLSIKFHILLTICSFFFERYNLQLTSQILFLFFYSHKVVYIDIVTSYTTA